MQSFNDGLREQLVHGRLSAIFLWFCLQKKVFPLRTPWYCISWIAV